MKLLTVAAFTFSFLVCIEAWEMKNYNSWVVDAVHSNDGNKSAIVFSDGRVLLRSLSQEDQVIASTRFEITSLCMNSTGEFVFWGDYEGNVFCWSDGRLITKKDIGDGAIRGLCLSEDSNRLYVTGDGEKLHVLDMSDLSTLKSLTLGMEQILAMDLNAEATGVLFADHSGLMKHVIMNGNSFNVTSYRPVEDGIVSINSVDTNSDICVLWTAEEEVIVYDLSEREILVRHSIGARLSGDGLFDAENNRFLFSLEDGRLMSLGVEGGYILSVVHQFEEHFPHVSLGKLIDGTVIMDTREGARYRLTGHDVSLLSSSPVKGDVVDVKIDLRTSEFAVFDTNGSATLLSLDAGVELKSYSDTNEYIIGGLNIREGKTTHWALLRTFESGSSLLLESESGLNEVYHFESWVPSSMCAGAYTSKLAFLSANGRFLLLDKIDNDWDIHLEGNLESEGELWDSVELMDHDNLVLFRGSHSVTVIDLETADRTSWGFSSKLDGAPVKYNSENGKVYFTRGSDVFCIGNAENPERILSSPDSAKIIHLGLSSEENTLHIVSESSEYSLSLETHEVLSSRDIGTVGEIFFNKEGPFGVRVHETGRLELAVDSTKAILAVFPELKPIRSGGMGTGSFGTLLSIEGKWFEHRDYGWGYAESHSPSHSWSWMLNEGLVAHSSSWSPYFYSQSSNGWLYGLYEAYATDWVYDYSLNDWRAFGK